MSIAGNLGRHLFGVAALGFGVIAWRWHDFNEWQQLRSLWGAPAGPAWVSIAAVLEITGGIAIQARRTAGVGAALLGIVYLMFALRWIPRIVAGPQVYDSWGNLFEQLSLVAGALIVYGSAADAGGQPSKFAKFGYYLFGICVVSFTLEQLVYLEATAGFVPRWIPPSQMFWSVTTTLALALGAAAVLSGYFALAASRLLTVMFVLFGLLIWVPRLLADPHQHINWGGNAENFAITGAAWIVADFLSSNRSRIYSGVRMIL
jgi:uncharacterized membrane protein YphA (DoxX/SURF4 family)